MFDPTDRPYAPCAQLQAGGQAVDNPDITQLPALYRAPQLDILWAEVCAANGLTVREMRTASRQYPYVKVRQAFMWAAWEIRGAKGERRFSLSQIGAFISRKIGAEKPQHHTTVLTGWRRHKGRMRDALLRRVAAENAAAAAIHGAA